jgi:hypothetical protein
MSPTTDKELLLSDLLAAIAPLLPTLPALEEIATYVAHQNYRKASDALRAVGPAGQVPLVRGLAALVCACRQHQELETAAYLRKQLSTLLQGSPDLNEADILLLFDTIGLHGNTLNLSDLQAYQMFDYVRSVLAQVSRLPKANGVSAALTDRLYQLVAASDGLTSGGYYTDELLKLRAKALATLSQYSPNGLPVVRFDSGDAFGRNLNEFAAGLQPSVTQTLSWLLLLTALSSASGGRPAPKLEKELSLHIAAIGPTAVREQGRAWLELLAYLPLEGFPTIRQPSPRPEDNYLLISNIVAAKGLVWALAPLADAPMLQQLADLAIRCLRKLPGHGPLAMSLGNAALLALSQNGLAGMAHLASLRPKMAQENTKSLIAGYLQQASETLGISPDEMEDMSVPDFGLRAGSHTVSLGDYHAHLTLAAGKVDLQWTKAGQPLKAVPAALKTTHATELKALKNAQTQAQQTYTAQRERLDRSFLAGRRIAWAQFTQHYQQHGLLGELVRPLIWRLHQPEGTHYDALMVDGAWVDAQGQPVPVLVTEAVQLWHPVLSAPAEVLAWRALLDQRQVRQPIKQAFREVYLLTPPEENTRTYSNRMAAHILRQHQLSALARGRGWSYRLLGNYDGGHEAGTATLELPAHGLQAQFWVSPVNADNAWNDTGIWNYVSTDQVRFVTGHGAVPLPEVPPLVFSEVMRDTDLFVGVASVGNDPQWRDNGGLAQYRAYWESYSFGELGEVAKSRKLALERLVPRLKIGRVSEIRDRFLVVRGKRRTYKIHLGSGNILMEPNDQYLCIVPDRSGKAAGATDVFLPFEGDAVLSIILSKALLLMDDDKITDGTILRQIK